MILLLDAKNLIEAIKVAAVEAVEAGEPVKICFGTITSTQPLRVLVEQKITLGNAQLVLTKKVIDDELHTGEHVLLLQMQGGQKYVVLDKVVTI